MQNVHIAVATAGLLHYRAVGHYDAAYGTMVNFHAGKHSRTKTFSGILYLNLCLERARRRVDGRVYTCDCTFKRFSGEGVETNRHVHAFVYFCEVAFGGVDYHFHYRRKLSYGKNGLRAAHVAGVIVSCGHYAAYGRYQHGVLPRVVVLCTGGVELRLQLVYGLLCAGAYFKQRHSALVFAFDLVEVYL